jgi:HSP20 family molecular chaperone IbpA
MQMDKLLSRMSAEFRAEPPFHGMVENPAYSLSMNVEDLKDRFVVRAFLPDTSVADVKVRLDGQTLKVEVGNRQNSVSKTKTSTRRVAEWGEYEQVIQLPSPVKAGQMKVARKDHELLITLPKE